MPEDVAEQPRAVSEREWGLTKGSDVIMPQDAHEDTREKFYRHLFGGQSGLLALFSGVRMPDGDVDKTSTRYFDYPASIGDALAHATKESDAGREVWHCAHLLTGKRRIKENAAPVVTLWGDLDGAEVPNGTLKPTGVVESSPGRFHPYWRLSEEIPPELAEDLNKRLATVVGADPSGFDLTQLLRVPGTVNYKYPDRPVVKILGLDGSRSYTPRELDEALPKIEKSREPRSRDTSASPPVVLAESALRVWRGEETKLKENGDPDRSSTLVKIGRVLYDAGAARSTIVAALAERDEALGHRKYTGRDDAVVRYHEIMDELESNGRNTQIRHGHGVATPLAGFNLTDLGNSERFIAHHGEDVRYCYPWSTWLVWTGARWERDVAGRAPRLAKEAVRSIYREASEAEDEDRRKALAKHATRSEGADKIRAMIELARSEQPVTPDELDVNPLLLNAKNGTIDLRTGELREHRREDLITKMAPVEYEPNADAPTWAATLERVLPSPALRTFFKKLCGYAISGDVSEHILPVLYGIGANGKSTILNALLEAVGEYGMQAAPDLLIAKRGGHPTEVADLFGMRLVASIEVEDGRRLAEALVKSLTGGDKVRARRMRQDFWEFTPTHTAFLCTNHKPEIRGTDTAIWRRIRLIPFTETIPPAEQDKKLPEKLRAELPGILRWMVEGCLEWQRSGLQAPEEVRQATAGYRSEMDVIGAFLSDECVLGSGLKATLKDVYERYEQWCEEGGERAETKRKFNARLTERGQLADRRSGPGGLREWHGLELLTKQNAGFAGKLTKPPGNDYNSSENNPTRSNGTESVSSSAASVKQSDEGHVGEAF
jgi:putative DNA primase/helicase